jgi:hypothetical protein
MKYSCSFWNTIQGQNVVCLVNLRVEPNESLVFPYPPTKPKREGALATQRCFDEYFLSLSPFPLSLTLLQSIKLNIIRSQEIVRT